MVILRIPALGEPPALKNVGHSVWFSGGEMWSLSHHEGEDSGFEQLDLWVTLRGQLWMVHAIVFPSVFVQAVWVAVDL